VSEQARYSRQRLGWLIRGGAHVLYARALDTSRGIAYGEHQTVDGDIIADEPFDQLLEKLDLELGLSRVNLPEKARAFGALMAMGYRVETACRLLSIPATSMRRLLDGTGTQPGLVARLEAVLNGGEEAP
jgi:hypothetical protein